MITDTIDLRAPYEREKNARRHRPGKLTDGGKNNGGWESNCYNISYNKKMWLKKIDIIKSY